MDPSNMQKFAPGNWPPGQYKVVTPDELENWTGRGWKLVFVVKLTRMAEYEDQEANPKYDPNRGYSNYGENGNDKYLKVRRFKKVAEPRFVLVRDENSLADVLTRERDDLACKLSNTTYAHDETIKELATAYEKISELEKKYTQIASQASNEEDRVYVLSDKVRTYERDIAKLREQFGAKALREALGHD